MLLDGKTNRSQQCALEANRAKCILGCSKHSVTSRSKEGIVLLYSVFVQSHPESSVQFWASQFKKDGKVHPEEGNKSVEKAGRNVL